MILCPDLLLYFAMFEGDGSCGLSSVLKFIVLVDNSSVMDSDVIPGLPLVAFGLSECLVSLSLLAWR